MSSTAQKAVKGSVQVKPSNNRLQLVFTYQGKRRYVSTGYADTPRNRKVVQCKAAILEDDIEKERFDETLKRYQRASAHSAPDPVDQTPPPSLLELWSAFIEYKRHQCSPSTMRNQYKVFTHYLNDLPTHQLAEATQIRNAALENIPLDSCKRFITRLSACCDWAIACLREARIVSLPSITSPKIETADLTCSPMVNTATQPFTFQDYLAYDDGTDNRYELVDGQLVLMNPPRTEHLLIAKFLEKQLDTEIQRLGLPWLTFREAGVRTGFNKSRLADLCVVTREQAQELLGQSAVFQTPPQLIIEVVSPESITRDYRYKRSEYAAIEVPEYWIVDPLTAKVTVLRWEEGLYEETVFAGEQAIASPTLSELTLTVAQILAAGTIA
nr:Uma2 family endonuclease [Halomicronema sp. CCY15110]